MLDAAKIEERLTVNKGQFCDLEQLEKVFIHLSKKEEENHLRGDITNTTATMGRTLLYLATLEQAEIVLEGIRADITEGRQVDFAPARIWFHKMAKFKAYFPGFVP